MTEAQKYEGALYKEKPGKGQKKGQNTPNNKNPKANAHARNQQPRVEDASESDHVKFDGPPPPAPTPPPAGAVKPPPNALTNGDKPVNVFDYLVTDETPNVSKVSLAGPKEQMTMVAQAPSLFKPSDALAHLDTKTDDEGGNYDVAYEENGFSYGADPIPPSMRSKDAPHVSTEFVTPAPKKKKDRRREEKRASASVSEKKRKRGHGEELSTPHGDVDTPMGDAPSSVINNAGTPVLNHSGLTGGLNRMMRSPSPHLDDTPDHVRGPYQDTSSPIKRTRRNVKDANGHGDPGLGISIKNRAERLVSSMFGGSVASGSSNGHEPPSRALVRTRRASSSSAEEHLEVRKKKSHRSRHPSDSHAEARKSKRKSSNPTDGDRPSRRQKQIDERRRSDSRSPHRDSRQVTVYRHSKPPARTEDSLQREIAQHFLSFVSRDSERGCSFHKALKRFHRDMGDEYDERDRRADRERQEDERDLWRALRLRRNDRGEIVVFV